MQRERFVIGKKSGNVEIIPLRDSTVSNDLPPTNDKSQQQDEQKYKKFYGQGIVDKNKFTLMLWDKICKPKIEWGLGLKNQEKQNLALGAKLLWKIYKEMELTWERVLKHKYLNLDEPTSIFITSPTKGSRIWKFLISCSDVITNQVS